MDIQSIIPDTSNKLQPRQGSAAASVDPATEALKRPVAALQQRREKNQVQISVLGQLKSALADVHNAANALAEPSQSATIEQVKMTVQNFVVVFNNANSILAGVAADKSNSLAGDNRIRQAGIDLNSVGTAGNIATELDKIGMTANRDGFLTLDTQALEKAFQANPQGVTETLAKVAHQTEGFVTRPIDGSGNAINAPGNRVRNLAAEQNAQQARTDTSQREIQQRANQIHQAFSIGGIASYQRMFSL